MSCKKVGGRLDAGKAKVCSEPLWELVYRGCRVLQELHSMLTVLDEPRRLLLA